MFFIYWNSVGRDKKSLLFYSPLIFLSVAILTRLIIFLPIFNKPSIGPYSTLLLLPLIFLFLKTRYEGIYKTLATILVFLIPIGFVFANFILIENDSLRYSELDEEFVEIADSLENRYLLIRPLNADNDYLKLSRISYVTINKPYLITPSGGFHTNAPDGLLEDLNLITEDFENLQCNSAVDKLKELEVVELLSYNEFCDYFEQCGLELKEESKNYCIYSLN